VRASAYARANPLLVGFIVAGLIARIAFWAITNRRLDDALITESGACPTKMAS
jgi:hypothetical protein